MCPPPTVQVCPLYLLQSWGVPRVRLKSHGTNVCGIITIGYIWTLFQLLPSKITGVDSLSKCLTEDFYGSSSRVLFRLEQFPHLDTDVGAYIQVDMVATVQEVVLT